MDDVVKQAMAKWPNVPHCFGWLSLDARGHWRMRDEAAQQQNLPGDKIEHVALRGFINRNYDHDPQGRWYFQNGPQRVYVNLEATPFIARTDPQLGFVLQTGAELTALEAVFMTDAGQLILQSDNRIALLDDRDLSGCLSMFEMNGSAVDDQALLTWLSEPAAPLYFVYRQQRITAQWLAADGLPARFGYIQRPQPD